MGSPIDLHRSESLEEEQPKTEACCVKRMSVAGSLSLNTGTWKKVLLEGKEGRKQFLICGELNEAAVLPPETRLGSKSEASGHPHRRHKAHTQLRSWKGSLWPFILTRDQGGSSLGPQEIRSAELEGESWR